MKGTAMNNDWFMDYASHRVRLIALEQEWLEIRYWHLFDEQERRGWITKNGRHILIGEDSGSGGSKSGKSVDKSGGSGIIKSIDVDDYKLVTYGKGIESEVDDVILNTMKKCEKNGNFVISEVSTKVVSTSDGTPVLQIEPTANGLLKLNINAEYLSGKTLEEINKAFADTDSNLAVSLEEAVVHESGHAISIKGKKPNEVEKLYQELKDKGKTGVSMIARDDGAECLAELEVLRYRGTKVSKELSEFYEKYMGRKY